MWTVDEVEPSVGGLETHEKVHLSRHVSAVLCPLKQYFFANKLAEHVRVDLALLIAYSAAHCACVGVKSRTLALQKRSGQLAGVGDNTGALLNW